MSNPPNAFWKSFFNFRLGIGVQFILFFLTLFTLYLFFFFRLSPILQWVHSDLAVVYLMANTPITLDDHIYYWGTNRYGVVYSFLVKCVYSATGHVVSPEIFYHFFSFFYLACLALLWFLPLHPALILILLTGFLPTTNLGIQFSLFPGQPHGSVLFLLVLNYLAASRKNVWLMIVSVFLLFLTYAPGGCLGVAIFLAVAMEDPAFWKNRWKSLLLGGAASIWLLLFLKTHTLNLQNFSFSLNPDFNEITDSWKKLFLFQGLALDAQDGIVGLGFLILSVITGGYVGFFSRKFKERIWGVLLLCWSIGGLTFIGLTKWYVYNARDIRYPSAVAVGSIVLFVIIIQKRLVKPIAVILPFLLLIFVKEMPVISGKVKNPTGQETRQMRIYREALQKGCGGVVGGYWDTMYLGAWSRMRVLGSSIPLSPNPKFHDKVASQKYICLVDSDHPEQETYQISAEITVSCPSKKNELVRTCQSNQASRR